MRPEKRKVPGEKRELSGSSTFKQTVYFCALKNIKFWSTLTFNCFRQSFIDFPKTSYSMWIFQINSRFWWNPHKKQTNEQNKWFVTILMGFILLAAYWTMIDYYKSLLNMFCFICCGIISPNDIISLNIKKLWKFIDFFSNNEKRNCAGKRSKLMNFFSMVSCIVRTATKTLSDKKGKIGFCLLKSSTYFIVSIPFLHSRCTTSITKETEMFQREKIQHNF